MAQQLNVIYTNSGPRTPTGATSNQPLAGLSSIGVYVTAVAPAAKAAPYGNPYAAAVLKSNGESIGNARQTSNPLPPGFTS